ncbi:MAG: hypothetical protein A9Z00_14915 [Thermobacillus sp. ZCTH02-B1]|nr:MAG: hypothetical protein A9Z00_14915 [Thermobacillus sp. ZCTH02-B1]
MPAVIRMLPQQDWVKDGPSGRAAGGSEGRGSEGRGSGAGVPGRGESGKNGRFHAGVIGWSEARRRLRRRRPCPRRLHLRRLREQREHRHRMHLHRRKKPIADHHFDVCFNLLNVGFNRLVHSGRNQAMR